MHAPDPKPNPIEVPDDVKAELNQRPGGAAVPKSSTAEPIPEDVLAEADAQLRAAEIVPGDDATLPVQLDEDSEL